jgi:hypothetical protein
VKKLFCNDLGVHDRSTDNPLYCEKKSEIRPRRKNKDKINKKGKRAS